MKNLNKKIGVMVLSGVVLIGGFISGKSVAHANSEIGSKGSKIEVNEEKSQKFANELYLRNEKEKLGVVLLARNYDSQYKDIYNQMFGEYGSDVKYLDFSYISVDDFVDYISKPKNRPSKGLYVLEVDDFSGDIFNFLIYIG